MKRLLFFFSIFSIAFVLNPRTSTAHNSVLSEPGLQFGFFTSSLAPHGEWFVAASGMRVWRPFHISNHWRPYLVGRWVWTDDYGWYWMSDEPFGWITYHYGRWYYDDDYGWVWMPDDVWAPAWVEWRYDDDYIGWAPLPPYAAFSMTFGIRFTTHWIAPAHYWNVVRYDHFGSVIRYRDTAPEEYARRLIKTGRTGSQYGIDHDRIINHGIERTFIEHRGNIRFPRTEVRKNRGQSGERMIRSNEIEIFRPSREEIQRSSTQVEARRDERAPQVQEPKPQNDRQEMRRELIQRHGSKMNPSPPAGHEFQQHRVEQKRENSRIARPEKPIREKRSENKNDR
jgi:hypothetical protein